MRSRARRPASAETAKVMELLRSRYSGEAYGMLTEVGNSTGFACSRWCDALAMSLWPSRGIELIGIEVKASRSDWLKELQEPAKAEAIQSYCDRWYVACASGEIVKLGELPPTWGLMVATGGRLVVEKEAPKLEPTAITREFLAAIFRRASQQSVDAEAIKAARDAGYKEGHDHASEYGKKTIETIQASQDKLLKQVEQFQQDSGISIFNHWSRGKEIGKVVREVIGGTYQTPREKIEELRDVVRRAARELDAMLESPDSPLVEKAA